MNKRWKGINEYYIKFIPFCALALVLCQLMPFLVVKSEKVSLTSFSFLINLFSDKGILAGHNQLDIITYLIFLPLVILVLMTVITLFCMNHTMLRLLIGGYAFATVCAVLIIFMAKRTIDGAGFLKSDFLVGNLGIGYWGYVICCIVGLVIVMKVARINPGYIVLVTMSVIWLIPILWIIMISFRDESGSYTSYFWPKKFTLKNYYVLLTDSSQFYFVKWFFNTLFVAVCSCLISTFIVLSTSFTLSRLRFHGRRGFMNLALILGMFPSFMSMIAVYYILKGIGLTHSLAALILVYSGGAALGYYIVKGFFDTIPKALDEAAIIDGASRWKVFTRITIPLSKPVIIYTMLISFLSPWGDYIFARVIMGDKYDSYTVALGLYTMLDRANIATWYTRFAAGAVLISIPISILFISLQKYYVEGLSGSVKG